MVSKNDFEIQPGLHALCLLFFSGEPELEMSHNPHSNWKIPWKKRSTMFVGKRY